MRFAFWLLVGVAFGGLAQAQTIEPKLVTVAELKAILAQDRGTVLVHFSSTDKACQPCLESNSEIPFVVGQQHWVHPFLRVTWSPWTASPARLPIVGPLQGLPLLAVFVNGKEVKEVVGYSPDREEEIVRLLRPFNHGASSLRPAQPASAGPPAASLRFPVPRVSLLWGQAYGTSVEARNAQGKPMVPPPALQWSSSAENIAAVDVTGRVHTIRRGQATITARSGGASASIIVEVTGFADLAATSTDTSCAVTDNRLDIYCWGNAANNRIFAKHAPNAPSYSSPVQIQPGEIPSGARIASLAIGKVAACALTEPGRLYCWGDSAVPTAIPSGDMPAAAKVSTVAAGAATICAVATDSQFYCWGSATAMPIGPDIKAGETLLKPTKMTLGEIPPHESLTAIGLGRNGGCVLADADAYCWSAGSIPKLVSAGDLPASVKLTVLSVSDDAACALGDDGRAYCFDKARNGSIFNSPVWKLLPSEVKLKQLSVGHEIRDSCAIGDDRHIYCGGHLMADNAAFQRVVCAPGHCAALSDDGRIYSWGPTLGSTQSEAVLGRPVNSRLAGPALINAPMP